MLSGKDLLQIGFSPNAVLGEALRYGNKLITEGSDREAALQAIKEHFDPRKNAMFTLREESLSVSVACTVGNLEESSNLELSLARIREISRVPVVDKVSLMPDTCPSGGEWGSMPVGGALITSHHILPAAHSADINCGMQLSFFESRHSSLELMKIMKESCFFGGGGVSEDKQTPHPVLHKEVWTNPFLEGLEDVATAHLGTQGDGNHFSYVGVVLVTQMLLRELEECGKETLAKALFSHEGETIHAIVTHHGSRRLGAEVYKRGMRQAEKATRKIATDIPKAGCWLDLHTEEGALYKQALDYVGQWTEANHEVVHDRFLRRAKVRKIGEISNHHNAVWFHQGMVYHGKGATPAWKIGGVPQVGIIPLNMSSEILLVKGLDNQEFLSFAPHGAGRNKSRTAVKREFLNPQTGELDKQSIQDKLGQVTPGIHVVWASGRADISESPIGYKSAEKIKDEIGRFGLARVISSVSPRGCMMAGESQGYPRLRGLKKGDTVGAPNRGEQKPSLPGI